MLREAWNRLARRMRRARRLREIRAGKTVLRSLPATVNMEFSGRCNVWPPCTYCVGKNAPGYEEPPHITKEQLAPYWKYLLNADRVNDTTYGEPLMYPGMHEVIDRLGEAGVKFGFTSNGLLLSEKKARLLTKHGQSVDVCISLNAASKEVYYIHQGKDFDKLLVNIRRYIAIHNETRPGQTLPLILSFIVMQSNKHEVMDFVRLVKELGVQKLLFRHLFEMGVPKFEVNNFKHHFVYGKEQLPFEEYQEIEKTVRACDEVTSGKIVPYFAWSGQSSFIAEQSEPGVNIPCLFPWKFLCIRPIHNLYSPCVYIKKPIARTATQTVDDVWNGEIMQGLRESLAKGEVPKYCCEHSDCCPLVLEKRQREARAAAAEPESPHGERRVSLPVLASAG